jgi:hypothetical protein
MSKPFTQYTHALPLMRAALVKAGNGLTDLLLTLHVIAIREIDVDDQKAQKALESLSLVKLCYKLEIITKEELAICFQGLFVISDNVEALSSTPTTQKRKATQRKKEVQP